MSPRTFVARSAALFALAALGLAACESKTVVQPAQFPLQIAVTPSSLSFTKAGDKATMVATLTGGDAGQATAGVTWASSNTAVATVDANGVVTAVANGTTTITATSKAVPTLQAAAVVTVNIPVVTPPTPPAAPTVSIQSITDDLGHNVDITNVFGQINVALNVDVPPGNTIQSVNVLIDGTPQCSQTFSTGNAGVGVEAANAVTIVCPINTLKLDASGKPVFANGPHTITATLVAPGGTVKAQTSQTLTFANVSAISLAFTTTKAPVINPQTGLAWRGGSLTVTATPILFGGSPIAQVTFTAHIGGIASGGPSATVTAAPFTATFSAADLVADGGVADVEDSVYVTMNAVTSAGTQFTQIVGVAALALDNVAPDVTDFVVPTNQWINGAFAFGDVAAGNFAATDGGVDNVTVTFQAAPAADTSTWKTVTNGASLAEVAVPTYIVKAIVTDALGNSATFYGNSAGGGSGTFTIGNATTFAVDLLPPTIKVDSAAGNIRPNAKGTALGANGFVVASADTGAAPSGYSSTQYKIIQYTSAGATCLTIVSGKCAFVSNGASSQITLATLAFPVAGAYDSIYVRTKDVAGNTSAVIQTIVLQDPTAPSVGGLSGPATVTGNSSPVFSTSATDNLDLGTFTVNQGFSGGGAAGALTTAIGSTMFRVGSGTMGTFGLPLETSFSPSATIANFIATIETTAAGAPSGTQYAADTVQFNVSDVAGSSVTRNLDISANVNAGAAFTFTTAGVTSFVEAANNATVCNGTPNTTGKVCGTVPTSTTLTAVATGASGTFANPFARVVFYRRTTAGYTAVIGTATAASAVDNGVIRTWTYTVVWTPAGLTGGAAPGTTYNVLALGVDASGRALAAAPVAIAVQDALQ